MSKFNLGDKVRIHHRDADNRYGTAKGWNEPNGNAGAIGYVTLIDSPPRPYRVNANSDGSGEYYGYFSSEELRLAVENETNEEARPVNFILQYELDTDSFEAFHTMKEVEARIKELAERSDLKKDSVKVYEIAKTYAVTLDTVVKMRVTGEEKEPAKRPAAKSEKARKAAKAAYARAYYHRKKGEKFRKLTVTAG